MTRRIERPRAHALRSVKVWAAAQVLPLSEYIFNTEAHPFPMRNSVRDLQLARTFACAPEGMDLKGENYSAEVLQRGIDYYRALLPRSLHSSTEPL
jgi:hypothetical protein